MVTSVLREKSYDFALSIVKLVQQLQEERREFVLSKQILRSGTAIGALIREAQFASSTRDYVNKFNISLEEANESVYWLQLLYDGKYIDLVVYESATSLCKELIAMLVSSIKTLKSKKETHY